MITSNVMGRVFHIRVDGAMGTAFTVDVDGRQYWVTAKHLMEKWGKGDLIEYRRNGQWLDLRVTFVGRHPQADVAILVSELWNDAPPMEDDTGVILGQDVWFLGFPHGWGFDVDDDLGRGCPMPFVRRACVSAFGKDEDDGHPILILDGQNNVGFSGGPVVARLPHDPPTTMRFVGVVCFYRWSKSPVFLKEDDELGAYVESNIGLVVCEYMRPVKEMIQQNPVGRIIG